MHCSPSINRGFQVAYLIAGYSQKSGTEAGRVSQERRLHPVCELLRRQRWAVWGCFSSHSVVKSRGPSENISLKWIENKNDFVSGTAGPRWCSAVWRTESRFHHWWDPSVPSKTAALQTHGPWWPGNQAQRVTGIPIVHFDLNVGKKLNSIMTNMFTYIQLAFATETRCLTKVTIFLLPYQCHTR